VPELPEMENYKQLLTTKIAGHAIVYAEVEREKSVNVPASLFISELQGRTIARIERRAKHLLFHLDSGKLLLLHLMLGGWMFYGLEQDKPDRTVQITLSFGSDKLYFIGLRLGYLHLLTQEEARTKLGKLGPEPLEPSFTSDHFSRILSAKRGPIKLQFVDQSVFSGIGNCYSDEICFHAGILPNSKAHLLSQDSLNKLYHSMSSVLLEAIRFGGYMENPLYIGDTLTGKFDPMCKVYGREGEPCTRCGAPIIKEMLNSRKMFYCPGCQH
jgi:formamidopyrimidine-DNA glycosylase